jgi:hypothetical protein
MPRERNFVAKARFYRTNGVQASRAEFIALSHEQLASCRELNFIAAIV